jgi:uncharacterized PurR-regulated membrane protein YhhQ (DUF165 family)
MIGYLALAAYAATIPAANWLIGNVGPVCVPNGPCLIPVAPGLMAPSGVLMIGAALVLRDAVHATLGARAALLAVVAGIGLSFWVAPPALALASAAAFAASELVDLAVFARLRARSVALAVLASGLVGAAIDSAAFLLIAFGSLDYFAGQVVGKAWATAAVAAALWVRGRIACEVAR